MRGRRARERGKRGGVESEERGRGGGREHGGRSFSGGVGVRAAAAGAGLEGYRTRHV